MGTCIEKLYKEWYNLVKKYKGSKRGVKDLAVLNPMKPIRPTVVKEEEYIKQVLEEAFTQPSQSAREANKKALELLKMLKG